jgi:hypothetical protein
VPCFVGLSAHRQLRPEIRASRPAAGSGRWRKGQPWIVRAEAAAADWRLNFGPSGNSNHDADGARRRDLHQDRITDTGC